jgi:carbonic anhydrase
MASGACKDLCPNISIKVTNSEQERVTISSQNNTPDKFHCYSDVNQATQKQVLKLRSHPWIPSEVAIRGFVFDLATGELREVTPKDEHAA